MSHIYKRLDSAKPSYTVTGSGGGGTDASSGGHRRGGQGGDGIVVIRYRARE